MKWLRGRRPSPALVISLIAFVVACAGTAGAATGVLIKSSSQVAPGSIESSDLRNGRAVNVADLTPAARAALRGVTGPQGGQGQPGVNGRDGFASVHYVTSGGFSLTSAHQGYAEAVCAAGEHVLGGGVWQSGLYADHESVNSSFPSDGSGTGTIGTTAWSAFVDNTGTATQGFAVYAVCAKADNVVDQTSKAKRLSTAHIP